MRLSSVGSHHYCSSVTQVLGTRKASIPFLQVGRQVGRQVTEHRWEGGEFKHVYLKVLIIDILTLTSAVGVKLNGSVVAEVIMQQYYGRYELVQNGSFFGTIQKTTYFNFLTNVTNRKLHFKHIIIQKNGSYQGSIVE